MISDEQSQSVQRRTFGAILSMGVRELAVKGLAFAGWIVLSRLLDPATFGVFAVVSFALNLFILLSEVGLGASLIRQPEVGASQLSALFTYQLAWCAPITLAALGASLFMPNADIAHAVQVVAISFLLISLRTTPSIIAQRELKYAPIVVSDVTSQVVYWAIAISAALVGLGIWSVILSALAFAVVNVVVLYLRVGWRPSINIDWSATHADLPFSLSYQSQQGASLAKYALLPILGGFSFGATGVGYLTWAHQIAVIPIQLTQLVSRVSFPALARLQHDRQAFAATVGSILKWTCIVTYPACALLIGLGPQIIEYIYDPKWLPALSALYLFTLNTAINIPVGVLLPALYSLGRGKQALRILVIMLATTWGIGVLLALIGVGLPAASISFIVGMVVSLALVAYELRDFGGFRLLVPMIKPGLVGLVTAGILLTLGASVAPDLLSLLIVGALAGIAMLALNLVGEYGRIVSGVGSKLRRNSAPAELAADEKSTLQSEKAGGEHVGRL